MLRMLIFLILFSGERGSKKCTYSIVGLRLVLERLLEDTKHFSKNDIPFFDLTEFDRVIRELLEDATLNMVEGALILSKISSAPHTLQWHPFLLFVVDNAVGIEFDREAINGKYWKD